MIKEKTSMKNSDSKKYAPLQALKGMRDILPEEMHYWDKIHQVVLDIGNFYGFNHIDVPILEYTDLFTRAVGEGTDVVEKEMYAFKTKGGDNVVLRPEMTAGVMRSFVENGMSRLPQPVKLWYLGPNFRYENPQAGRYRQFYQVGLEILGGNSSPAFDAQIIVVAYRILEAMSLKGVSLNINSIGCSVCRSNYKKRLQDFYTREIKNATKRKEVVTCKDCERRLDINILRLLDCKEEICKSVKSRAPSILDNLCTECSDHFKEVLELLDEVGVGYTLNPFLVRGLDYYNRTVFEFIVEENNMAIGGGGRYDYLSDMLGGGDLPAVGLALGIDRIAGILKQRNIVFNTKKKDSVFLIHVGDTAKKKIFSLLEEFRLAKVQALEALGKDSLQAQMKVADRENCSLAVIIGQKEVYEESAIIRDMKTGTQESVPLNKIIEEVKKRLHK